MPITELQCRKATCPPERPRVRFTDEKGLYLEVSKAGGKHWYMKYRVDGVEKRLAVGSYPEVSLAEAREAREGARKLLAGGDDPMEVKKAAKAKRAIGLENTFQAVAKKWFDHWSDGKSARHADYVWRRLETDLFPEIGKRPAEEISARDLTQLVKKVQDRGAIDLAHRLLQTSGQILRYAVAHDLVERNPAADIKPSDVLKAKRKQNYARVPEKDLGELLRRIEAYQGGPYTRMALKLMCLTFVRTSELIKARWIDFDLEAEEWRIPGRVNDESGEKVYGMKMGTVHIVPLSAQAIEVLRSLKTLSGERELLFPGERDHSKPMSNNTILKALERMGYKGQMTGHGFRGVASTILHEQGFPHEHIELQLAHQERNAVSAAYNHALYLKDRRTMMQAWASHLDALRRQS